MQDWLEKLDDWTNRHRPTALLAAVFVTVGLVALLSWITSSDLIQQLFDPKRESVADVRFWSALIYTLAFVMGLPVAFLLWHWRDRNVRDQIENSRKDINLKEFLDVQRNAAGALDEKLPFEAREQLQIAALHQLRGFLRGDYGPGFKRPALELLLAGHAAAIYRIGVPEVQKQISGKSGEQIKQAAVTLRAKLTTVDRVRMAIIRDEAEHIFTRNNPLVGRRFDLLDLWNKKFPDDLILYGSHFFAADLYKTNLKSANLSHAFFQGADLSMVDFNGTDLHKVDFQGANLSHTNLRSSNLRDSNLGHARLKNAQFDYQTKLLSDWEHAEADSVAKAQSRLRKRGAVCVD